MPNPISNLIHYIESELSDDLKAVRLWIKGKHVELSAIEARVLGNHLLQQADAITPAPEPAPEPAPAVVETDPPAAT